jgi:hypothetical protein
VKLLASSLALLGLVAALDSEQPSRSARTYVIATAADGAPVPNLTAADFKVFADETPLETIRLGAPPHLVTAVLLVDRSISSPSASPEFLAAISDPLFKKAGRDDRLRAGVFAQSIAFGPRFVSDARALNGDLSDIANGVWGQPSRIWDAVDAAVDVLAKENGNRAVLLVTDGRATGNHVSIDDVARRAVAEDIAICIVSEGRPILPMAGGRNVGIADPNVSLKWLSSVTGGLYALDGPGRRVDPLRDPETYVRHRKEWKAEPGRLLSDMVLALRNRYLVEFAAPASERFQKLRVSVARPDATVSARQAFVTAR